MEKSYDDILTDWCHKLDKGYPTIVNGRFSDPEEVRLLNQQLSESGHQPYLMEEATKGDNPQDIVYEKYGKERFIKSQLKWVGGLYSHLDWNQLSPETKQVPLTSVIPVQSGEEYWNESSKQQSEDFKEVLNNGAPDDIDDLGRQQNYNPILVDKNTNKIIDGHHRHAALKAVGSSKVWAILVDLPMPIRAGKETEVDDVMEAIELNEATTTDDKEITVCVIADMLNLYGNKLATLLVKDPKTALKATKATTISQLAVQLSKSSYNSYAKGDVNVIKRALILLGIAPKIKGDKSIEANSIASGVAIFKRYGKVHLARDQESFQRVKDHASNLWKTDSSSNKGDFLSSDNWCPADMFISVDSPTKIAATALKAKHITISSKGSPSLNSYFANPNARPTKGKFVGISLKQKGAQAGKATKFLTNILAVEKPSKAFAANAIDKSISSIVLAYKGYVRYVNKPNARDLQQPAVKVYSKGVAVSKLKDPAIKQLLAAMGTMENFHKRLKGNKLPKAIKSFMADVDKAAAAAAKKAGNAKQKHQMFVESRDRFVKALKASKVLVSSMTNSKDLLKQMIQLSKTKPNFNLDIYLVQKIATYDFFVDIFTNWTKNTKKLKQYFQDIAEVSNPFVAVTLYAIGEAGLAPMFTKLMADHWDDFSHDYEIDASTTAQKVRILDNPANAGFDAKFQLDFGVKKYQTKLSFRFSSATIRIEVQNLEKIQ